jgi:hypothetical protein
MRLNDTQYCVAACVNMKAAMAARRQQYHIVMDVPSDRHHWTATWHQWNTTILLTNRTRYFFTCLNGLYMFLRNLTFCSTSPLHILRAPLKLRAGVDPNVASALAALARIHGNSVLWTLFNLRSDGASRNRKLTGTTRWLCCTWQTTCWCATGCFCRRVYTTFINYFGVCLFHVILYFSWFKGHPRKKSLISDRLNLFLFLVATLDLHYYPRPPTQLVYDIRKDTL